MICPVGQYSMRVIRSSASLLLLAPRTLLASSQPRVEYSLSVTTALPSLADKTRPAKSYRSISTERPRASVTFQRSPLR
ncbi:hypothetical protein [Lysobacter gummosus]|uniref:hypothetical protein n=1 Tax=Lysobacter gummosus TaxID=262324 RepID=UPI0036268576